MMGHDTTVKKLLNSGAEIIETREQQGTLLLTASITGKKLLVRLLIEAGAALPLGLIALETTGDTEQ